MYDNESSAAAASGHGERAGVSQALPDYLHHDRGTASSTRHVLPPMRSGPLTRHADMAPGIELEAGGTFLPSGFHTHGTGLGAGAGHRLPPPQNQQAQHLTRNGKGKSSSFPVTATDYEGVLLPPLGQMYPGHKDGVHSNVSNTPGDTSTTSSGAPWTGPYHHLSKSPRAPVMQYPSSATRLSDNMEEEGEGREHASVMSKPLVSSPLSSPQFLDEEECGDSSISRSARDADGHGDIQMMEDHLRHDVQAAAARMQSESRVTKLPSLPSMLKGGPDVYEESRLHSQLSHSTAGSMRSTLDDFEELFGERPDLARAEAKR